MTRDGSTRRQDPNGPDVPPTKRMDEAGGAGGPSPTQRMDARTIWIGHADDPATAPDPTRKLITLPGHESPPRPIVAATFVPPPELPPGFILHDKYVIGTRLSQKGGQADIYLCRLVGDSSKQLVLKLYTGRMQPDLKLLQQLQGLKHPDIIACLEVGDSNGRYFEIMEYAAGGTLAERARQRPFSEDELTTVVIPEVLNGLSHCHSVGIIHRDIKQHNLFYRNADHTDIVIGDFGISSRLEVHESVHYTGRTHLTLIHAAPEQLMGSSDGQVGVGPEVDFYALGITLIFLMNANSFLNLNDAHVFRLKQCNEVPLPENISDRFVSLMRGLLHPNPKARWGGEQVAAWLRGETVSVEPTLVVRVAGIQYCIGKEVPNTIPELARLLQAHPREALADIGRGTLARAVDTFDVNLGREVAAISDRPGTPESRLVEVVHTLDPTLPYEFLPGSRAKTPAELAKLIDTNLESWQAGIAQLKDGRLPAWLRAIGQRELVQLWETNEKALRKGGQEDVVLETFLNMALDQNLATPTLVLEPSSFEVELDDTEPRQTLELRVRSGTRGHLHGAIQLEGDVPGITLDATRVDANRLRNQTTTIKIMIDTSNWERGVWRACAIVLDTNGAAGRRLTKTQPSGVKRTTVHLRVRNAFPTRAVLRHAIGAAWVGAALAAGYRMIVAASGHPDWLNRYFGHYLNFKEAGHLKMTEFVVLPLLVIGGLIAIIMATRLRRT